MKNLKVKITRPEEMDLKVPQQVLNKIIRFTQSHSKFTPVTELRDVCKIPQPFFNKHVVCMNCGYVEEKATYAIAQNAMGHEVIFTCECGFKTVLR